MGDLERRTIAKLSWRLVPFLVICYFAAYLDRVNVSFARPAGRGGGGVLPRYHLLSDASVGGVAAAGIAVINSVGNLAGFFGPFVMGWLKDRTGDYAAGLWVIAACAVVAMIVALVLHHDRRLEKAPAGAAAE